MLPLKKHTRAKSRPKKTYQSAEVWGFTLLEILVVIGISILLVGIGIASVTTWRPVQTRIEAQDALRDALREASLFARAGRNNENWNVTFTSQSIVVQGAASSEQQTTLLPQGTTLSWNGANTLTFTSPHGFPDATKQLTLTAGNTQTTYLLNTYGVLEKQ